MKFTSAEKYLIASDLVLGKVIKLNGHVPMRPKRGNYEALVKSIISQQISVKAAANIFDRFRQVTGMRPELALQLSEQQIKSIGLSGQKSRYLHDLAQHFVSNPKVFDHLEDLSDQQVIDELTKVHGIGIWTAQMFLMFTLQRPDVFAPGDRGLQLAMQRIYKLPIKPKESDYLSLAEKWRPHRTTASLHLWQSLTDSL